MDAKYNSMDDMNSTFYLPDGTKLSKYKISKILSSKFKTKPFRTSDKRGFQINKKDVEKMSKQYEVVDEIIVSDLKEEEDKSVIPKLDEQTMTQMTQMTHS
jgi:hypothetical protein